MAKEVYNILAFDGGLNNVADPRDIAENQLSELQDAIVDSKGKIVMMGSGAALHSSDGEDQDEYRVWSGDNHTAGHGLFTFSSDYQMLNASGGGRLTPAAVIPHNYLIVYNRADNKHATIYQERQSDSSIGDWGLANGNEDIYLGANHSARLAFYFGQGAVRISDFLLTGGLTALTTQWLGLIPGKLYGGPDLLPNCERNGSGISGAKWYVKEPHIAPAFPESDNGNGDKVAINAIANHTGGKGTDTAGFAFANEKSSIGAAHNTNTHNTHAGDWTDSGMYWGAGLLFNEEKNGSGTWMPSTQTRYQFWISTMYDDGAQESAPQRMAMYGAEQLIPDYTSTDLDVGGDGNSSAANILYDNNSLFIKHGFAVGQTIAISGDADASNVKATAYIDVLTAQEMTITVSEGGGVSNMGTGRDGASNIRIKGHEDCAYNNEDGSSGNFAGDNSNFNFSKADSELYFCDGGQLGAELDKYGTVGLNVAVHLKPVIKIQRGLHSATGSNDNVYVFGCQGTAITDTLLAYEGSANLEGNARISGVRYYWASSEDGYGTKWLLFDCDFAKGTKSYGITSSVSDVGSGGESGYAQWQAAQVDTDYSDQAHYIVPNWNTGNKFAHPPRFIDYFTLNGHEPDDITKLDNFRCVVIANQRAYAGNFTQDGIRYPDRMIKSPPGQFDKFPASRFIDVVIDDGDEIIHLATYADRVLQFKRKTLYIINISDDREFLEATYKFKGVEKASQVTTIDTGVAWANRHGVYFYDGKAIHSLFEQQGNKVIDVNEYNTTFLSSTNMYPMIGYIQDKKQLIIAQDDDADGSGDVYIYDMPTASWSMGKSKIADSIKTNFINDWNGDLIYYDYAGNDGSPDGSMKQWSSTPTASSNFKLATRDIDFGYPGLRKKVYKVYIAYKGDASAVVVKYGINGETDVDDMYQFNSDNTPLSNQTDLESWHLAELIPTTKGQANNIHSFRIDMSGTAAANFEINDITIVYRMKGVK